MPKDKTPKYSKQSNPMFHKQQDTRVGICILGYLSLAREYPGGGFRMSRVVEG